MKRYKPFFKFEELRKNPEMNPHIGAWDYVDKYQYDPDVYISFTEIDKIGINPQSKFNTPVGIYTYPLKEFVSTYIGDFIPNKYKVSVGHYAPFAGNAKYINFIRVKNKAHFIEDMYKDYGSNNYDKDIKILESKYNKLSVPLDIIKVSKDLANKLKALPEKRGALEELRIIYQINGLDAEESEYLHHMIYQYINGPLEDLINQIQIILEQIQQSNTFSELKGEAIRTAKSKNPVMMMWNITRLLARKLSDNEKQVATKWNLILSKDLGYSGFADKSGKGYIHPSEPMQAVFFNTRAFEVIARLENAPAKKIGIEKTNL